MSYCIKYNPELNKKYPDFKKQRNIPIKKILIIMILFVSAYIFAQSGWVHYLLPGDPDETASAFSTLVERVGDGDPVREAVYGFCEEIITGGNN